MLLQFDELVKTTVEGWWLRFDKQKHFISQSVGEVDEEDRTVEIPYWLVTKLGLEFYEV